MEYVIISLIYTIYCLAYLNQITSIMIAIISTALFFVLYKKLRSKTFRRGQILIMMMSASIPISFRNILGGEFSANPLTWFYILGAIYFMISLLNNINKKKKITINFMEILILFLVVLSILPLMNSTNLVEGLKEYITYLFFLLLLFAALVNKESLNEHEYSGIIKLYIFGGLFASCGIIFQYIMFTFFSRPFFRIQFYGVARKYFSFMFYDMSCATVYLATVAFLILFSYKTNKIIKILLTSVVVVGMASSSSRSGLISLFIVLFLYAITKKGIHNKIILSGTALIFTSVSLNILNKVRGIDDPLSYLTHDSGRFEGYTDGLQIFYNSPLLGSGYDLGYVMKQMGLVVPHFALINMLAQTGIVITSLFVVIFFWLYRLSKRKALHDLKWIILISVIGSMIIPDFFSSRFFTIIAMLVVSGKRENLDLNSNKTHYG